jgi:tetratricopeptide (TPR) repeat protein
MAAVLAGLALVVLSFVLIRPVSDPDYWWHLRAGEELVETRRLPTTDPWSLTAELDDERGGPDALIWEYPPLTRRAYRKVILTGEWLSQVVLHGAWAVAGHRGTTLLAMLGTMVALVLAFTFAWRSGAPSALCVLTACVATWELWGWAVPRPQIFTYVAATAFVWLFDGLRRGRKKLLIPLAILAVLWSNLHLAYMAGILIGLAFAGGELVDRLLGRKSRPGLASAGLGLSVAGFAVNPNMLNGIPAMLAVRTSLFSTTIAEWQAPGPDRWIFFVLLALAAVSVTAAVVSRHAPMAHAALALGFGVMAASSYRHIPLFILLGLPASIAALSRVVRARYQRLPALRRFVERGARMPYELATLTLALLSAGALFFATGPHGFGIDEDWAPSAMAEHISELAVPGPVFNEYRYGGYLLWALDPPRRLFIDGRSLSERANWEYDQTMAAQRPIYPFLFERYGMHILALSLMAWPGSVAELLLEVAEDPGWVATFVGSNSVVFVQRSALPDSSAAIPDLRSDLYRAAIRQLRDGPGDPIDRAANLAVLYARLGVVDSARMHADIAFPMEPGRPTTRPAPLVLALGKAAERAGRPEEAIAHYHMAPGHPEVMAALGLLLLRRAESGQGDVSAALAVLGGAVSAGSCDPGVFEALDRLLEPSVDAPATDLISKGLYLRALRSADAALASGSTAEVEFFRGVALLRMCRYVDAESAFRRSVEADGGLESAPSSTLANLGWALFDGGHPDEALEVFERLLDRDAVDTQALYGAGLASKFVGRRDTARVYFQRYLWFAPEDDPWIRRVRDNLAELDSYPYFLGL